MKWRWLAFVLGFPLVAFAGNTGRDTVIHGIHVQFQYQEIIFPEDWRVPPINGRGESLKPTEHGRTGQILAAALAKYPPLVLQKNLRNIYVLKSISFYEVEFGGTNSDEDVFLSNNGSDMGYSAAYIEQTFHHEFSSILYRNFTPLLDEQEWLKANPAGFDYNDPELGVGAIRKNESSQELDTLLCQRGFLTQYALSGLENDINTIAQNLFCPTGGFWAIVDRYPRIQKKTRVMISFYHRIDPAFTEEFFRRQ